MSTLFSDRIADVPRSFIREILKVTVDRDVISFAGGLPNRDLFPVDEIRAAADRVFAEDGRDALQYSTSEGYLPLRQFICERYRRKGIIVTPDQVLITSGSQQGLDLMGKIALNEGDHVVIEEPGYLGAIQAFAVFRSTFHPVPLGNDGVDVRHLERALKAHPVKLFYSVPNFQNPAGVSYSEENRRAVAAVVAATATVLVEDDPYGELRFLGTDKSSFWNLAPANTVLLGSFSKIVAPSFRIGWIVAQKEIMDRLITAKQATDLHTNYIGQRIIHRYVSDNDIDRHIAVIRKAYGEQREAMVTAIRRYLPAEVVITEPEGGMFLWVTLPAGVSALKLFHRAIEEKVAFVPGDPFYVNRTDMNTMRLNFSCVDAETIDRGMQRLAHALADFI